jgi:hypothetical protein
MSRIIIGTAHGKNIGFDTDLLLAGRLLITADSGAGKSWLARVLFEQAFGKLQTIIIDPEGEFASAASQITSVNCVSLDYLTIQPRESLRPTKRLCFYRSMPHDPL